jgi:hypothetical protein
MHAYTVVSVCFCLFTPSSICFNSLNLNVCIQSYVLVLVFVFDLVVLAMGGIPVLKRSSINSCLDSTDNNLTVTVIDPHTGQIRVDSVFRGDIPVVIVSSWRHVTTDFLESAWANFTSESSGKRWDYSHLAMEHWQRRILGRDFQARSPALSEVSYL